MLGWHISIYRQLDGGHKPAEAESPQGARLAVWQTGLGGLGWIKELVTAGEAVDLGGNGYPCRYTAPARYLIPRVMDGPPEARAVWGSDRGDRLTPQWAGRTVIEGEAVVACHPDEWLLIEAWDES